MTNNPTIFACDMAAIAPADREAHLQTIDSLFRSVLEIGELDNGYSFSLPHDEDRLSLAATFIARESLCCPFFDFRLCVEDTGRHRRLEITGPPGVKPFIIAELGGHVLPSAQFPGREA